MSELFDTYSLSENHSEGWDDANEFHTRLDSGIDRINSCLNLLEVNHDIRRDLQKTYTSTSNLPFDELGNDVNIENVEENESLESNYSSMDKGIAWVMAICACLTKFSTWGLMLVLVFS